MRAFLRILPLVLPAVRLAWGLMRDRRVGTRIKLLPVLALLYVLSPLDILPDIVPVVGWADDLIVAGGLLIVFFLLAPWRVVLEHLRGRDGDGDGGDAAPQAGDDSRTVDGSFNYVEDESGP